MLIDALAKEKEQIRQEGLEQGKTAMYHSLQAILQHRLGDIPLELTERLQTCSLQQLNDLVDPALDVQTWSAFVEHLPPKRK
ncbi:MAG: DUF4351 domain-containing protein [Caldilineaceae bacterium]|nr:DUF4351 domain-containing protein [Caldilineaceae bacterium]